MTDRDDPQPSDPQSDDTQPSDKQSSDIGRRLGGIASGIDVGELETARTNVDGVVGRRRARKRVGAGLGAAAVIALVASAVVLTIGGNEPDTLVTTDDTIAPDIAPDDSVDAPEPTLAPPLATAQPVRLIEDAVRPGSSAGTNGAPQFGEWIVPWDDGFLVGAMQFAPQRLPDELPAEVLALFPQEVIDFFDGDLPDTIAEATEQLSEAGLLDVVTEVIQNNPAASDAIYGAPTEAPTLDVRFTVDGVDWEPREMVLPPGATYLSSVTAVGDRLAAVYSVVDPLTSSSADGTITVATTADLNAWTTQDIVVPSPGELPDGFTWQVSAQGFAANDNGWVVSVYDSVDMDPYALVPVEVRDEIDSANGFGLNTDELGITIDYDFDDTGNTAGQSRTFTWDELGVAPELAQLVSGQNAASTLWAATWDGEPMPTDGPRDGGTIAVTPAGFVQWTDQSWFSPDGITWAASPLPDGVSWVSGAFDIDGGLIVMASNETGETSFHRVDERGGNAVLLDLPVPAATSFAPNGPFGGSMTSGAVVSADPVIVPGEERLSVEADGYRLTLLEPAGIFEVTEVATGVVVLSESPFGVGTADDSNIVFDDAGITVTDPTTGEVLVMFSNEVIDASEQAYFDTGGGDYTPDFWVIASLDGERFVVDDLEGPTDGPTSLATNGTRLLVQSGTNWIIYDLA